MLPHRLTTLFVAFALLATACTGGDDSDAMETAAVESTTQVAVDEPSTEPPVDLSGAFTAAGVTIVDDPASAPVMSGIQVSTWQLETMEFELEGGGGYVGSQLDRVTGAPGGLPISYLLAGWMDSGVTANAEAAADLMGDQRWEVAPSLAFPNAVLVLFVADAMQELVSQEALVPGVVQVSTAQSGVCSTLAGWVKSALDFIFNSLKVDVEGSGFFSWLGVIWNAAVDLARATVEGVVETLTRPVISLIQDALAVVGAVSMAGSLLSRWWIDVEPSTQSFPLPTGDEPPREEVFTARVDTKIDFAWDDYIVDCARVANLDLPDPSDAQGSAVSWDTIGFPKFGSVTDSDDEINSDNEATLEWESAREESNEGDTRVEYVWAHATVVNDQYENLKSMVWGWISGKISGIPFEEEVEQGIQALLEPVFDRFVELVEFRGQGATVIIYHLEEDEDDSSDSEDGTTTTTNEGEGLIEITIGRATSTNIVVGNVSEGKPFTGHPEFTIFVRPLDPDCELRYEYSFDSNSAECSFAIEDGPSFLVGKSLTTDSINDIRYYSWVGSRNINGLFRFLSATPGPCIKSASWYFRIFEEGVTLGYPDGLDEYRGSAQCTRIMTSATTEYSTNP